MIEQQQMKDLFEKHDQQVWERVDGLRKKRTRLRIGIYGSSFDPITNGHLFTAKSIANRAKLDLVIFLPAADIHIKDKVVLQKGEGVIDRTVHASHEDRWNMVQLAIQNQSLFVAKDYEMLSKAGTAKYYTYFTMDYFKNQFPNDDVFFVMGADLLVDIANGKWSYDEELITQNRFIVMSRDRIDMPKVISSSPLLRNHIYTDDFQSRFELVDKGLAMEIGSTFIRQEFSSGGDAQYLLPDSCYEYIQEKKLYGCLPKEGEENE